MLIHSLPLARGAMNILSMVASSAPEAVDCPRGLARIARVLPHGAAAAAEGSEGPRKSVRDYRLARHACCALETLDPGEAVLCGICAFPYSSSP